MANCPNVKGMTLLYVGIALSEASKSGKVSLQTLRSRILMHYKGNACGSTLKLSLGCLLSYSLGLELRRVGNGRRMTFTRVGEAKLSEWMRTHRFVTWVVHARPWEAERKVLSVLSLPLNMRQNERHPFHCTLTALRRKAKQNAMRLPVVES